MANRDAPRGAAPVRHLTGGEIRTNPYKVDSSNATAIRIGDFVKLEADGHIAVAAAGDRLLGVSNGYVAALTEDTDFPIYDDPNIIFVIQANGSLAEANIGDLADILATAGSDIQSAHELDSSGVGTSDAQLKILGKQDRPDNDWGTNVDVEVQIYEHEFAPADQATPGPT